jgi:hypothetical protein
MELRCSCFINLNEEEKEEEMVCCKGEERKKKWVVAEEKKGRRNGWGRNGCIRMGERNYKLNEYHIKR